MRPLRGRHRDKRLNGESGACLLAQTPATCTGLSQAAEEASDHWKPSAPTGSVPPRG